MLRWTEVFVTQIQRYVRFFVETAEKGVERFNASPTF